MLNGLSCYPEVVVTCSGRATALLDGCRQYSEGGSRVFGDLQNRTTFHLA